jgi:hypothetical protein
MTSVSRKASIEVQPWRGAAHPAARQTSRSSGRSWSKAIALAATLSLHGLLIQSLLYVARTPKVRAPDRHGAGASHLVSEVPPADTLILISPIEPAINRVDPLEDLSSSGALASDLRVVIVSPDPLPLSIADSDKAEERKDAAVVDSSDREGRAQMFGRYTGQIDARIQRAWRRPRTPVAGSTEESTGPAVASLSPTEPFTCKVRILQDVRGFVQEIQLLQCNGGQEWQHSLVVAISEASPLPAPPIPSVFSSAMTLTFTATGYQPGRSPDGYEPDSGHGEYSSNHTPHWETLGSHSE